MKKLLLIALLIVGCAREFDCDVGERIYKVSVYGSYTEEFYRDGPTIHFAFRFPSGFGEKETEEHCEQFYGDTTYTEVFNDTTFTITQSSICRCEKS